MAESNSALFEIAGAVSGPVFREPLCQQLGLFHAGATTRCPSLQKRNLVPVSLILENLWTNLIDSDQQVYPSRDRDTKQDLPLP